MDHKYYDIVVIMETQWNVSQKPSVGVDVYKHFRRDRQKKRNGGINQYVRECLDFLDLNDDEAKFL